MKAVLVVLALVALCVFAQENVEWVQKGINLEKGAGKLGQALGYSCGPHSLMQCVRKITGIDVDELTMAKWSLTTNQGTTEKNLSVGIQTFNKIYNRKLQMAWLYYDSMSIEEFGKIMADPKSCLFFFMMYQNRVGHYEVPYKIVKGSPNLTIANSLGPDDGDGYVGYMEERSWKDQKEWVTGIHRQNVCMVFEY